MQQGIEKPSITRRRVVFWLTLSAALAMTGHGIGVPVFATALDNAGGNTASLAIMFISFSFTQFITAPIMGRISDRIGRKLPILIALFVVGVANMLFALADTVAMFVLLRAIQGIAIATLYPAALGTIHDVVDEHQLGKYTGIIMAGYGAGFAFGPVIGGILHDTLGIDAPFLVSGSVVLLMLIPIMVRVPETHRPEILPIPETKDSEAGTSTHLTGLQIITLMSLEVLAVFPLAFIEPELIFYAYETLQLSATEFGLILSGYGLSQVIGQLFTGGISDRYGRRLPILAGFLMNALFLTVLPNVNVYGWLLVSAIIAGLGMAFITPALTAVFLDYSDGSDSAQLLGYKQAATGLGYALGPLMLLPLTGWLSSQAIFGMALIAPITAIVIISVLKLEKAQQLQRHTMRSTETITESYSL